MYAYHNSHCSSSGRRLNCKLGNSAIPPRSKTPRHKRKLRRQPCTAHACDVRAEQHMHQAAVIGGNGRIGRAMQKMFKQPPLVIKRRDRILPDHKVWFYTKSCVLLLANLKMWANELCITAHGRCFPPNVHPNQPIGSWRSYLIQHRS